MTNFTSFLSILLFARISLSKYLGLLEEIEQHAEERRVITLPIGFGQQVENGRLSLPMSNEFTAFELLKVLGSALVRKIDLPRNLADILWTFLPQQLENHKAALVGNGLENLRKISNRGLFHK